MKCLDATYTTGKYFTITKSSVRKHKHISHKTTDVHQRSLTSSLDISDHQHVTHLSTVLPGTLLLCIKPPPEQFPHLTNNFSFPRAVLTFPLILLFVQLLTVPSVKPSTQLTVLMHQLSFVPSMDLLLDTYLEGISNYKNNTSSRPQLKIGNTHLQ